MKPTQRPTQGFTIIELMVVIAIVVILTALTVPTARGMMSSNKLQMCAGNLNRVGQALKMYYLDYQGVPPVYITENGSNPATPYDEMADTNLAPLSNALLLLWKDGYLRNKEAFHCPLDITKRDRSQPSYYESYTGRQQDGLPAEEQVKIAYLNDQDSTDTWNVQAIALNRYKYLPCRIFKVSGADPHTWVLPPSSYANRRQLCPLMRPVLESGVVVRWVTAGDSNWMPTDSTVVTWCDKHVGNWEIEDVGQYQVLWWDGSVTLRGRNRLEKGTSGNPSPAAWEVAPHD